MINKNGIIEDKNPGKSKVFGKTIKKFLVFIAPVLILIIVIGLIAGVFLHIVLLILSGTTEYKDDLDYCKYTYGLGWNIREDYELGHFCYFKEENGSSRIVFITEEESNNRVCKRKFYNPSYCG